MRFPRKNAQFKQHFMHMIDFDQLANWFKCPKFDSQHDDDARLSYMAQKSRHYFVSFLKELDKILRYVDVEFTVRIRICTISLRLLPSVKVIIS